MIIRRDQYEAAYKVGLERHDGKIGLTEAARRLKGTGLEETSAKILAGNVSYFLKGEIYKRAISIPATNDYLTWIRRDRGDSALANALQALHAHIEYYEAGHNTHRKGLREVWAKHKALLKLPEVNAIQFEYDDSESRGYVDILPLELFAEEGTSKAIIHMVRHSRSGKVYKAQCDITVRAKQAELNYQPYPAFNLKNEMLLGMARLQFEDTDRTAVLSVEWKPKNSGTFKRCRMKSPSFIVPPAPPYVPPVEATGKSVRMVRERPGQAAFRRTLKSVYGNRCCITGCSVPEVLEGAHIDPYIAPASDSIRNGLLLRSDVHTLFDRHLIAIEPSTLRVHVAQAARGVVGYADLNGIVLQQPGNASHHPDQGALERHWKRFRSMGHTP